MFRSITICDEVAEDAMTIAMETSVKRQHVTRRRFPVPFRAVVKLGNSYAPSPSNMQNSAVSPHCPPGGVTARDAFLSSMY
jgi:hypothetical protein